MVLFLAMLLLTAVGHQLYFYRCCAAFRSLEQLLDDIEQVNLRGLQLIADCYLHPDKDQLRMEPPLMWQLIGEDKGLRSIAVNTALILELAVYAQRWSLEEGVVVSEMIRRDALRVKAAVRSIRWSFLIHGSSVEAPFHLQEAVSSYCLMRSRLLGLYHSSHVALLPRLTAVL